MTDRPWPLDVEHGLPRVAYGDATTGARALAELISDLVAKAEALGAAETAYHLNRALKVAEGLAAKGTELTQ